MRNENTNCAGFARLWYGPTEGDICRHEEIIAKLREIADLIDREERPVLVVTEAYSIQSVFQKATAITLILGLRFFYVPTTGKLSAMERAEMIADHQSEDEDKYEYTAGEVSKRPTAIAFAKLIGEEREPVAMRRKEVVPKLREIADLIEHRITGLTEAKKPWEPVLVEAHSFQSARFSAQSTAVLILRFVDL